jgi:hypothetical protein
MWRRKFLLAVSIALLPSIAQARTWYAVTRDANACENMSQLSALVGEHLSSPQDFMNLQREAGYFPSVTVTTSATGEIMVGIMLEKDGVRVGGLLFFSSLELCKKTVAAAIRDGVAPSPDQLR